MSTGKWRTVRRGGFGATARKIGPASLRYEVELHSNDGDEVIVTSIEPLTMEDLAEALKFNCNLQISGMLAEVEIHEVSSDFERPCICPRSGWLDALVEPKVARDVQANLEDVFDLWVDRHGERHARLIYGSQVARTIAGLWLNKALDLLERATRLMKNIGSA